MRNGEGFTSQMSMDGLKSFCTYMHIWCQHIFSVMQHMFFIRIEYYKAQFPFISRLFADHFLDTHRGLVAQWITRLPTEQKIPGSSPGKIGFFSFYQNLIYLQLLIHYLPPPPFRLNMLIFYYKFFQFRP